MWKKIQVTGLVLASVGAVAVPARAENWDPDSEADNYADVWLRADLDRTGAEFWIGTTTPLSSVNLASNLVITQYHPGMVDAKADGALAAKVGDDARSPVVRAELGPALAFGGLFLLPKIGLGYDFERKKLAPLVPSVMTILEGGPAYVESWLQFFLYSPFDSTAQDSFYTRDTLAVALSNQWALGAEVELTVALKNSPSETLRSLAVGPRATWSPAEVLAFGLFVGYETVKSARPDPDDFLAGRITATLAW